MEIPFFLPFHLIYKKTMIFKSICFIFYSRIEIKFVYLQQKDGLLKHSGLELES